MKSINIHGRTIKALMAFYIGNKSAIIEVECDKSRYTLYLSASQVVKLLSDLEKTKQP